MSYFDRGCGCGPFRYSRPGFGYSRCAGPRFGYDRGFNDYRYYGGDYGYGYGYGYLGGW